MVSPFMADAEKLAAVREALPSLSAGIQLDAATAGPMPAEVAAAMAQIETYERDIGRADAAYADESRQRVDEARAALAAVLGADLGDVALTASIGGLLAHLHAFVAAQPGDEVLPELGSGGSDASEDQLIAAFDAAIGPSTRLVALPHVDPSTGRVLPVARIAEIAHRRGAVVAVDGSHAAGALPIAVSELGCDVYLIPGHTWLLGPEGLGAVWLGGEIRERLGRSFAAELAWGSQRPVGWERAARSERPARSGPVEAAVHRGSEPVEAVLHRPSVVGLARAIGWLTMYVSLEFVHRRGRAIARYAADRLAEIDGVSLLTPRDAMATIVTWRLAGWPADRALAELASRTFAIAGLIEALDAIRIAPGFWTTSEEIDRFVDAVRLLAAHTPETLPPRRTLAILGEA